MEATYEGWQRSGQTQAEYAKGCGIALWAFKYRVKQGKKREKVINSDFIPIKVRAASLTASTSEEITKGRAMTGAPYCEIRFEGGHGVRIESRESMGYLRALLGSWGGQ